MKLTRKERARVLKAAEQIFNNQYGWSCSVLFTIAIGEHGNWPEASSLRAKYADFYGYAGLHMWPGLESYIEDIEQRVIMLLLFREVCK